MKAVNSISSAPQNAISEEDAQVKSVSIAMESYKIDNNKYTDNLSKLTTPIAYMISIPKDAFSEKEDSLKLITQSDGLHYILYSIGPDKNDNKAEIEYDPTNGANSAGDIIKLNN